MFTEPMTQFGTIYRPARLLSETNENTLTDDCTFVNCKLALEFILKLTEHTHLKSMQAFSGGILNQFAFH